MNKLTLIFIDFYRSKEPVNLSLQQTLLSDLDVFLSDDDVESCEEKFSLSEITQALNGFAAGKTPFLVFAVQRSQKEIKRSRSNQ